MATTMRIIGAPFTAGRLAAAAALGLAACGAPIEGPPAAVFTPPTAAQVAAVNSLMRVPDRQMALASTINKLIGPDGSVQSACSACSAGSAGSAGSASVYLNSSPVTTTTRVQPGRNVISASFAACTPAEISVVRYDGAVAQEGDFVAALPGSGLAFTGTTTLTHANLRSNFAPEELDFALTGRSTLAKQLTAGASAGSFVRDDLLTVHSGGLLTNRSSGRTVTQVSGSQRMVQAVTVGAGGVQPTRVDVEYRDLSFTLDGKTYVIRGSENYSFGANGAPTAATGEIAILTGTTVVARLRPALPQGYTVHEVTGNVATF